MSDILNRGDRDFSKYDLMETEKLEEILRLDSEAPEGTETDTEKILYIMEVLTERNKIHSTGKTAQQAWEAFNKHYLPQEEPISIMPQTKPAKTGKPWLRRLAAIAAVVALVAGLSATANAFSWGQMWDTVAKWAKETFSFVGSGYADPTEPAPEQTQQYTSLQQALSATGQKSDFLPTQIPDGYKLQEIIIDENPMQSVYVAVYKNTDKNLMITVRSYLNGEPEKVEFNEDLLELYKANDSKYYIFLNSGQLQAVWLLQSYECCISGDLTMDEIKAMINSIGKG